MNLFRLLAAARNDRVELRPIKHMGTDLRRPRDARRFAHRPKTVPLELPPLMRRQAE